MAQDSRSTLRKKKKAAGKSPAVRPNPMRMGLFALAALLSVTLGIGINVLTAPEKNLSDDAKTSATPGSALFPDSTDNGKDVRVRAYEEALPDEVFLALELPPKPRILEPPFVLHPPKIAEAPHIKEPPQINEPPRVKKESRLAPLPKTAKKTKLELLPWRRFSVVPPPSGGRPRIVIVIDDLGVDRKRSNRAIELKGPLTLSFLTYAEDLRKQTQAARENGHELLVHIPMEPGNKALDPGPNVLLTSLGVEELRRRLQWSLSRFDSYVGINNHMGSKFTTNTAGMKLIIGELKRRGLLYLDSRTTSHTVGSLLAQKIGVPYADRNIFLDNVNEVDAVNARLKELESVARKRGLAIAIGHPKDATLQALKAWLNSIEQRGFVLVPLSSVVRHQ